MGNVVSVMRSKTGVLGIAAMMAAMYLLKLRNGKKKRSRGSQAAPAGKGRVKAKKRRQAKIDRNFVKQFKRVMARACGPREYTNFAMLSVVLIARTFMSLWIAQNMGQCVEEFCNKRWDLLRVNLYKFSGVTVFAAVLNACLKYFVNTSALDVRRRLTRTIHKSYMEDMKYYKANKVADKNGVIENADQLITDDIAKFSDTLSDVFSNLLKPIVDFVLFSGKMATTMGALGPLGMYSWFAVATVISASVLPAYGKLAVEEQRLEGRFRASHTNLIHNAEMVAFMRGEKPELKALEDRFIAIRRHMKSTLYHKLISNTVMGYVNKYFASVVGFSLTVWPVLKGYGNMGQWTPGQVAKYYVATRQLMEGLANAVLAIFELQKRIGKLSGLTARVDGLFNGVESRLPILQDRLKENIEAGNPPNFSYGDIMEFKNVNIYKPDGTLLVKGLTFKLEPGMRVIITGDNGCGKSSALRLVAKLWPLVGGTIVAPRPEQVYFLSQANFVPLGTLRDIMIYPHSPSDMAAAGKDDAYLQQVLEWAHLANFKCDNIHPELDDVLEWDTALSPGQKQRMAFARLLYHNPTVAVLDECTNGVSPAVEEDLYNRCRLMGMSVISISHKIELRRLHDYRLHYNADEEGTYSFTKIHA